MTNKEIELLLKYMQRHYTDKQINMLVNKTSSLEELRKNLGEIDIEYFALAYFSDMFFRQFGKFQNDLIEELKTLLETKDAKTVMACPRGHGKSTMASFLFPMWCTLYNKSHFVLIVSATMDIAKPFLEMIKDEIKNNDEIKNDFGDLIGDKWNAEQIFLKNKTSIAIRGIDGGIRGARFGKWRPSLILGDDLLKDTIVGSESKNDKLKDTFFKALGECGDTYTKTLIVGTVLDEDDLMSQLLDHKTNGWKKIKKTAIITESDSILWEEWQRIYFDYSKNSNERENEAKEFFENNKEEMLQNTEVLWEDKLNYYDLMIKKADNPAMFASEYMNNPANASSFPLSNAKCWTSLPDIDEMDIVMYADPSAGKSKKADFTAIVTVGKHKKTGQLLVLDGDIRIANRTEFVYYLLEKIEKFSMAKIYGEANGFQEQLLEYAVEEFKKNGFYNITIKPLVTNAFNKKADRINSLEPLITNGSLLLNPNNFTFNEQIKKYNANAKHDDAPDALALALQQLITKKITGNIRCSTVQF